MKSGGYLPRRYPPPLRRIICEPERREHLEVETSFRWVLHILPSMKRTTIKDVHILPKLTTSRRRREYRIQSCRPASRSAWRHHAFLTPHLSHLQPNQGERQRQSQLKSRLQRHIQRGRPFMELTQNQILGEQGLEWNGAAYLHYRVLKLWVCVYRWQSLFASESWVSFGIIRARIFMNMISQHTDVSRSSFQYRKPPGKFGWNEPWTCAQLNMTVHSSHLLLSRPPIRSVCE